MLLQQLHFHGLDVTDNHDACQLTKVVEIYILKLELRYV